MKWIEFAKTHGRRVALSLGGEYLIVGTPFLKQGVQNEQEKETQGQVRVYQYTGDFADQSGDWILVGQVLQGESMGDYFGVSVDISADGKTIVVGDIGNHLEKGQGRVTVYEWNNTSVQWDLKGEPLYGEDWFAHWGTAVVMSADGNVIASGSVGMTDEKKRVGTVRTLRYNSILNAWEMFGVIRGEELSFGRSLDLASLINGEMILAVGAPANTNNGNDAGLVEVYKYVPQSDQWTQLNSPRPGVKDSDFGTSLALSGDGTVLVVGSPFDMPYSIYFGKVDVFFYVNGDWIESKTNLTGKSENDRYGFSVCMSWDGKVIAAGAYLSPMVKSSALDLCEFSDLNQGNPV